MSIPEIKERCKYFGKKCREVLFSRDLVTILIIVLVGMGSYGLGILSEQNRVKTPLKVLDSDGNILVSGEVSMSPDLASVAKISRDESGKVVASKSGSAYHFPWCSGASRIKEENKIWFENKADAEKAGYVPAKNCPGL